MNEITNPLRDGFKKLAAGGTPYAQVLLTSEEFERLLACWDAFNMVPIGSIKAMVGAGGVPVVCDRLTEVLAERDAMKGQRDVLASLLNAALDVVRNVEAEGSAEDDLLRELLTRGERAVLDVFGGRIPRTPVELAAGDEHCPKCEGTGRVRFDQCTECVGGGVKLPF